MSETGPAGHRGPLIGAVGGLLYVLLNAGVAATPVALALRVAAVAAFVVVVVAARRSPTTSPRRSFGRAYRLVVAGEVLAIVLGVVVLHALALPRAQLPWVTLVVGVHFVVLGGVWRAAPLRVVGAAVTVCGVAGLVVAAATASPAAPAVVAGIVPGALLLAGSASAVASGRREG